MKNQLENLSYVLLLGAVFAIAFSIAAGETLLTAALVIFVAAMIFGKSLPRFPGTAWLALIFIIIAAVSTRQGVNPSLGFSKFHKLFWFSAIPLAATLVNSRQRLSELMGAYAFGTGVLSLERCILIPLGIMKDIKDGIATDFMFELKDRGSMTDGQQLMLGMLIVIGIIFVCVREKRAGIIWWILLSLQCAAMIVNMKRGSWICTVAIVTLFIVMKANWRYLLAVIAVILIAGTLPFVRNRVADFRNELKPGGRITMWTKIAPELVKRHPLLGIGFKSLTSEMMKEIAPEVEDRRDHLHSNIAQVLVDTGWIGFSIYIIWMSKALFDALILLIKRRGGRGGEAIQPVVLMMALLALLLNGLVEYNFADSELTIMYGIIMGCVSAALARDAERPIIGNLAQTLS